MSDEIKTKNFRFFTHTECEYFPCHDVKDKKKFNCLFCYCPLYALGESCGGNFIYTDEGVKDCSRCKIPHGEKGYDYIIENFQYIRELARRKDK